MEDLPDRGPILLETALTFGILTFCVVTFRLAFRAHKRWIDGSDWCLAIALVREPSNIHARFERSLHIDLMETRSVLI